MLEMMIVFRSAMTRSGEMARSAHPGQSYAPRPVLDPIDLSAMHRQADAKRTDQPVGSATDSDSSFRVPTAAA